MVAWEPENVQYGPDWEADFYNVGLLPYDAKEEAYVVENLDYIVEQAHDWEQAIGDFVDDADNMPDEIENRAVFVETVWEK